MKSVEEPMIESSMKKSTKVSVMERRISAKGNDELLPSEAQANQHPGYKKSSEYHQNND